MYFPAYEIITGQHMGNGYYAGDKRDIDPRGVRRVRELFDRHVMHHVHGETGTIEAVSDKTEDFDGRLQRAQEYVDAQCEEELLRRR